VLLVYSKEHLPHTRAAKNAAYTVSNLAAWWGDKRTSDVTPKACRAYTETRTPSTARRDLQTLRAAIGYWHKHYGPLPSMPAVIMPPAEQPRERWLTRKEAARLLRAARHCSPYLARMVLLGLYTGSRLRTILGTEWAWIDLDSRLMRRRAPGALESKQKKTPEVRLGRRIIAHLRRWRRLDDPRCRYVCHYDGKLIDYPYVQWRKAVKLAGLGPDVTPHTLRHTRAAWLMQSGRVDIWQAAGHLGMSPQILMRVYGKHSPDYQREAAEI
jgi:integrase